MADIMRCKVTGCGFVAFHIQMSAHFKSKHPDLEYNDLNAEKLGNSDADVKKYGYRPSIKYYRAKLEGKDVTPFDFEPGGKFGGKKR